MQIMLKISVIIFTALTSCGAVVVESICRPCEQTDFCCTDVEPGTNDDIYFMLTFPTTVTAGTRQEACLSIHRINLEEQFDVEATIILHNSKVTVIYDNTSAVLGPDVDEVCSKVQIPKIDLPRKAFMRSASIAIDLQYQIDGTKRIIHAKEQVSIMPPYYQVYINTDKPIYNAGQTVLFRIVQLNGYYPTNHTVEKITITDPLDRKVVVLTDRQPDFGLISDRFELIAEPKLGNWKIAVEVSGREYFTTFEVKEYVLPKFEVSIIVPACLDPEADSFPVKICGRYTYGRPVNGSVQCEIFGPSHADGTRLSQLANNLQTDSNGCVTVLGDPDLLQFRQSKYSFSYNNLKVVAKMEELLTGETLSNTNEDCKLLFSPYIITVDEQENQFRPGIPYDIEIFYHDCAGNPLPEKRIAVDVTAVVDSDSDTGVSHFSSTTNAEGKGRIILPTSHNVERYIFTVFDPTMPTRLPNLWDDNILLSRYGQRIIWSASRVKGTRYSYVNFDRVNGKQVRCDHNLDLLGSAAVSFPETQLDLKIPDILFRLVVEDVIIGHGKAKLGIASCSNKTYQNDGVHETLQTCNVNFVITLLVKGWTRSTAVLAYMVHEDLVLSDDVEIPVECYSNTATVTMNPETARPRQNVSIFLNASPSSLCALSIVDKSVYLLGKSNSITTDKIQEGLARPDRDEYHIHSLCYNWKYEYIMDDNDYVSYRYDYWRRKKRSIYSDYPDLTESSMNMESFKNLKLLFLNNLNVSRSCIRQHPIALALAYDGAAFQYDDDTDDSHGPVEQIEVRNFFPETWKWDLVKIGSTGQTIMRETLPDTITEWIANLYCLSYDSGIAVSNSAHIKGFKPIFLSISMPYSVIRGEEVVLNTVLFSYFPPDVCLEMVTVLDESEDFSLLEESSRTTVTCICGGKAESIQYNILPLNIGEIPLILKTYSRPGTICGSDIEADANANDGVERTLLVEAEGVEEETTLNDYICLEGNEPAATSIAKTINVPGDHYEGSARLLVNVIGNIMGPALENLNHLIRAPFGCGEQNMVTMVPNIVVYKYLSSTGKLQPDIQKTLENHIRQGYQRQLNYQRHDGSFSAFGNSDSSGSTWLTAFVIFTFNEAKKYVFVDDKVISMAINFIETNRRSNGCVKKVGLVHHKTMMGGADGTNALNAYVSLALFHSEMSEHIPPFDIRGCDGSSNLKLYTKAIKFYHAALAGNHNAANILWDALQSGATLEDGDTFDNARKVFWTDETEEQTNTDDNYWYDRKPSDAVEVTGYVLLGYVKMEEAFPKLYPIAKAYPIVQWLTTQRNAQGGFTSTQNTVIGLSALSAYASRTYVPSTEMQVEISDGDTHLETFSIDDDNNLVVQQFFSRPPPSTIVYTATGRGCALMQTDIIYNIPREPISPSFSVSVNLRSVEEGCSDTRIRLLVVCAAYQGTYEQPISNMVVFEITMISGYEANKKSLQKMADWNLRHGLKRYEIEGKKVNVYFRAISSEKKCAAFEVNKIQEVKHPQPGIVRVYDYYDPAKSTTASYNLSCVWETYDPKSFLSDCLLWSESGHCLSICIKRVHHSECIYAKTVHPRFDYCNAFGNSWCGDRGKCINTDKYFRCSCEAGYRNTRWNRCVAEDEEPEIIDSADDSNPATMPECNDDICPALSIVDTQGGNETHFCWDGYRFVDEDGDQYCEDNDECLQQPCDQITQVCENTAGSYQCICKQGFESLFIEDEDITTTECSPLEIKVEDDSVNRHVNTEISNHAVISREESPERIINECPSCHKRFPKHRQLEDVFCPKWNVFVGTKVSDFLYNLKPLVLHGMPVDVKATRNVTLAMDDSCDCSTLLEKKMILATEGDVVINDDGSRYISISNSVLTPKNGWRKILDYECPGSHANA